MSAVRTGIADEAAICGTLAACRRVAGSAGIDVWGARPRLSAQWEALVSLRLLRRHGGIASKCKAHLIGALLGGA